MLFKFSLVAIHLGTAGVALYGWKSMSAIARALTLGILVMTLIAAIPGFVAGMQYLRQLAPEGWWQEWQTQEVTFNKVRFSFGLCLFAVGIYSLISAALVMQDLAHGTWQEHRHSMRELAKALCFALLGILAGLSLMNLPVVEYILDLPMKLQLPRRRGQPDVLFSIVGLFVFLVGILLLTVGVWLSAIQKPRSESLHDLLAVWLFSIFCIAAGYAMLEGY